MTFAFVSGNVALDLAGTVQHRRADARDLLAAPDDLACWIVEAGLVDERPPVDADGLVRAVRLREAIYRLACAARDRAPYDAADRALLNAAAAAMPVQVQLAADGSASRDGDLDAVLSTVSRAAAELLTGPLAHAVKECAADECTRLYTDTSRRGSRRWCDMRWCGNRAKAATFRSRRS
ncbi:CGNR zinc finger domain-containing protein [Frankia sp. Cas4]|uniref:CGNR zinc finger domain-containing protein n=1 Tax=Frankia sp. Cas4 TaxID=3073927 RepID=UPI002AD305D6|nr:ABATE domain-containing protein [Frankia sp. Cas4]